MLSGLDVSEEMSVKAGATTSVYLFWPDNHKVEEECCVVNNMLLMHDTKLHIVCSRK